MSRRSTKAKAMCDSCSFVYDMRVMKLNSYDMLICPECFEGNYDLKNHPQNRSADVRDDTIVPNARPDIFGRILHGKQLILHGMMFLHLIPENGVQYE